MGDGGGGTGVGGGAHTGLVREEPSSDAVHEGGAETTTDDLLETEGVLDDEPEDGRDLTDVEDHDDDADDQVDERQDRHDDLGDAGDAADPTEDHHADEEGDDQAHDHLEGRGLLPDGTRHRIDDRVGLHRVEHETVGDGDDDREDHAHPAFPQPVLHVVGGAAAEGAVLVAHLVQLGESGLEEGGRRTDQGHGPHPEHRSGTTEADRDRDTGDVARSHAGGGRDGEGPECGQARFPVG